MDAVWFTVSFLAIAAIATKIIAKRRATTSAPRSTIPAPPVVEGRSLVRFVHTLFTKGLRATIHDEHARMGSVFTVSFLGLMKTTFLVGPDVLNHFYNGPESDINHGNMLDFMVPMFGKEVGYGVDFATRYEQIRFYSDPLKRPSKLRIHVDPIVQEVEVCFLSVINLYYYSCVSFF
jgi:sterol 14alpha-demethylase